MRLVAALVDLLVVAGSFLDNYWNSWLDNFIILGVAARVEYSERYSAGDYGLGACFGDYSPVSISFKLLLLDFILPIFTIGLVLVGLTA